jgi:hypothetical protein
MPGIGVLIEGAMQQAAHDARHCSPAGSAATIESTLLLPWVRDHGCGAGFASTTAADGA